MGKLLFNKKSLLLSIAMFLSSQFTSLLSQTNLTREESTLLKVTAGINYTFKNYANEIWPGYDLSKKSYVAYLPDGWALYINAKSIPQEFQSYPDKWPDLGTGAFIHYGAYKDLVGQFVFDFQIDSITTFAMGLPKDLLFSMDNPYYYLLSSTIHEGFHQYQHTNFGEIPWAREEYYPILDVENSILASLEMHLLEDALQEMYNKDQISMEEHLKQFAAVRNYRWNHLNSYIKKYEQGQEINEATARYVEMKSIECFLKLDYKKINNQLLTAIEENMVNLKIKDLLFNDMKSSLTEVAVSPDNMMRNRIYPIGAFLGYMLDNLKIEWKGLFQSAGSNVSFSQILINHFDINKIRIYME